MDNRAIELYNLGCDFLDNYDFKEAASKFEAALEIDPEYRSALDNLLIALSNLGDNWRIAHFQNQATRLYPDDPDYHLQYGCTLANLDFHIEAITEFTIYLAAKPKNAMANSLTASSYAMIRESKNAIHYLTKSITSIPKSMDCYLCILTTLGVLVCNIFIKNTSKN